jgi:hypothetical protein
MTMAKYVLGRPNMIPYLPGSSYNAGDVIVLNSLPYVAHLDNPPYVGGTLIQGNLAAGGAVYQIAADAAYGNGTYVYWDTVKQQISTDQTATAFPFGWIVAGPSGLVNDGGPTGSGSLAWVLHYPQAPIETQQAQFLATPRNMLDGGDFFINPWQRGTSITGITNAVTYGPDRWFGIGGASSSLGLIQTAADNAIVGFSQHLKMQRASSNSNTAALNLGQVLETADCVRCQGQIVTLSFWAKAGANYSGGNLTVALNHSTTAGNDTAAHLAAASTNWQSTPTVINKTQALTTNWTRYQFTGTVPATATQLGVLYTWTPSGTAGADDSVYFDGIQLEIGNGATPFEHRDIELELALCQRYFFQVNEPAAHVVIGWGMVNATNNQTIALSMPTQMRTAPTVTVSAGSLKINVAGTETAVGAGFAAGATHTANYITVVDNLTATAGQCVLLVGGAGAGTIQISADL